MKAGITIKCRVCGGDGFLGYIGYADNFKDLFRQLKCGKCGDGGHLAGPLPEPPKGER